MSSQAPAPSQPMNTPVTQSPTSPIPPEHTKYHAICTPLQKICPYEFPMFLHWDKDLKEKKEMSRIKEKIKGTVKGKHPKPISAPKSCIKQSSKKSSVTPEKEKNKCETLTMLLGNRSSETLEDID